MTRLPDVYGDLLIVRPPVPATVNKAGANYKSEVTHLEYSPRRAYDEWLSILDAIVACGGDAIYELEAVDEPFLDHPALEVDGDGTIRPAGSRSGWRRCAASAKYHGCSRLNSASSFLVGVTA